MEGVRAELGIETDLRTSLIVDQARFQRPVPVCRAAPAATHAMNGARSPTGPNGTEQATRSSTRNPIADDQA